MELFHSSPEEITTITQYGLFEEFLCFSSRIYVMTAGSFFTYRLEISEEYLIEAGSLFYHQDAAKLDELVGKFCCRFNVDENTAEEIISERKSAWNHIENCDAENVWDIQLFTARAAKILGYRGCVMTDEQGTVYMIDMMDHEVDLVRVTK